MISWDFFSVANNLGDSVALNSEPDSKSEATLGNAKPKYSTHSFGCHFVEVTWQPEIARLRVSQEGSGPITPGQNWEQLFLRDGICRRGNARDAQAGLR